MRLPRALLLTVPLAALALIDARDASACGGCFVQQSESTQVTGHKMILSVSKTQTTLWDQISYSGNPASFAWILPIKGQVDVGLSSDALFEVLDRQTQVTVVSPFIQCTPPPNCGIGGPDYGGSGGGGVGTGPGGDPGVGVIAQEVVGPYETVQLMASDPTALTTWLTNHSYNIPADIKPVLDAYVTEGFNFLALKLVPGQGVSAMKPVRVTTQGASPVLPLRMVAAGTGAVAPITLWVMGEGRYEPANFPSFTIAAEDITWNWDTSSSDYATLKQKAFDASKGKSWLIEATTPFSMFNVRNQLDYLVQIDPKGSGYADDMGMGAAEAENADVTTLFSSIPDASLWITRMHGELSRAALATDLEVGASSNQVPVQTYLQVTKTTGTPPACPTYPPCPNSNGGWGFWNVGDNASGSGSCAMTSTEGSSAMLSGIALAAALAFSRRRRNRR